MCVGGCRYTKTSPAQYKAALRQLLKHYTFEVILEKIGHPIEKLMEACEYKGDVQTFVSWLNRV